MTINFTPLHLEDHEGRKLHTALIGLSLGVVLALGLLVWYLVTQQQQKRAIDAPTPKQEQTDQVPGDAEPQQPVSTSSAMPMASPSATLTPSESQPPLASPTASPSGIMNP